ncbi:MAG: MBL fold metallo-hydrolase [Chromatiales bacterium]|jgi:glyoxylase-like metal-dependent hydrolase (beta-lactamase superfamily II)|nr:MBL fold metallo-hydrolase [Chromatiales bacterium]MDX9766996.1 MBL fold metallo-hydrolase [Ectothiorhodospiraceae bacterium]
MHKPHAIDVGHGITTVDAEYVRQGLAAAHLVVRDGRAAFIDTGIPNAVPLMLAAMAERGVAPGQVDYVMVTHVHLDHAGGAGGLMQALPNAKLVVHPSGARHMIDPTRLVESTRAVYGEKAFLRLYGEVLPIDAARVIETDDGMSLPFGDGRLSILHTPGHARHHYCVHDPRVKGIFTGDTFGISYREFDSANGPFVFTTTTPTQFEPEALHDSIERLMALDPEHAYLTHFGRVDDLRRLANDLHADIDHFVAIARRHRDAGTSRKEAIENELLDYLTERALAHGAGMPEAEARELLAMDADLDAQGLDVWLTREERAAAEQRGA